MTATFDTNRDPGDEQDDDGTALILRLGKDYYLELDENGCLSIPAQTEPNDTSS